MSWYLESISNSLLDQIKILHSNQQIGSTPLAICCSDHTYPDQHILYHWFWMSGRLGPCEYREEISQLTCEVIGILLGYCDHESWNQDGWCSVQSHSHHHQPQESRWLQGSSANCNARFLGYYSDPQITRIHTSEHRDRKWRLIRFKVTMHTPNTIWSMSCSHPTFNAVWSERYKCAQKLVSLK